MYVCMYVITASEKDSEETVVAAENSMDVVKEAMVVVEPGDSLPLSTDANTASAVSNESEQQQQKAVPKAVPKEPTASTLNSLQLSAGPVWQLLDSNHNDNTMVTSCNCAIEQSFG
jgi:hypothetical protein